MMEKDDSLPPGDGSPAGPKPAAPGPAPKAPARPWAYLSPELQKLVDETKASTSPAQPTSPSPVTDSPEKSAETAAPLSADLSKLQPPSLAEDLRKLVNQTKPAEPAKSCRWCADGPCRGTCGG